MNDAEYFDFKCPYTGKPCRDFKCDTCPTEEEERKWLSDLDKEEDLTQDNE